MAIAAISVVRRLARKKKTTMLARMLPTTRCSSSDEIAARMKIDWSLLTDAQTRGGQVGEPPLHLLGARDAVLSRLLLHDERDRALAVQERRAAEFLLAVDD